LNRDATGRNNDLSGGIWVWGIQGIENISKKRDEIFVLSLWGQSTNSDRIELCYETTEVADSWP
jgi:hypothetical protein